MIDTQNTSSNTETHKYPGIKYTVFEVNKAWQSIIDDFKNFEPLLGAMLDETLPTHTDFNKDPYPITIEFPAHKGVAFEFLSSPSNKLSVSKLAEYLQTILDKSIRLELSVKNDPEAVQKRRLETSRQKSHDYYFILDKEKNTLISRIEELFETEFKFSRPIQVEINNQPKDPTDEYAEDA